MAYGGTPLQTSFTFSYMRRGGAKPKPAEEGIPEPPAPKPAAPAADANGGGANPYETSIKPIIRVNTVEEFWETYNYLQRPHNLPTTTDYHFFRGGIKPTWEDSSNAKGGKWIVRLPKGLSSRYWEEIILALIGGQFALVPENEVCGAVLSIRYNEDILAVWNKTASDPQLVERIRDAMKKILQLPHHNVMEYKPHQTSMQDRSSFRNTQVWKPKDRSASAATREISGGSHHHHHHHGTSSTSEPRRNTWSSEEHHHHHHRKPKGRDMGRAWR